VAGSTVQSKQSFVTSSGASSQSVTLTSTTAGNGIWSVGHDGTGINKAMTCADNVNGSYSTQLESVNDSGNGNTIREWAKESIIGGTTVVTVSFPAADTFSGMYASEEAGVTVVDGHSGNTQNVVNGGAISSGAATNANTAYMRALSVQDSSTAGTPTAGAGFTNDANFASGFWNNGANSARAESKASVAAGSNSAAFTNGLGSTQTFNTVMIMWDEASAGGVTVLPPAGALTLSGQVPTVTATANQFVLPPAGSLSLTGFVPTVSVSGNQTVQVPAGSLTLAAQIPTVIASANQVVAPPAGSLSLTGLVPSVALSDNQLVATPAGSLSLTGLAPTVVTTQNQFISLPAGSLSLTGLSPTVIGAVVPPVITGSTPAGRPRRRYYVEVDGVRFDVVNSEQARQILERAKTLAREAAEQSAKILERTHRYTTETIAPVKMDAPRVTASPELRLPLKSVRRSINKIYREKSVIVELRMWLELEQRLMEDEDEAMLLLN